MSNLLNNYPWSHVGTIATGLGAEEKMDVLLDHRMELIGYQEELVSRLEFANQQLAEIEKHLDA